MDEGRRQLDLERWVASARVRIVLVLLLVLVINAPSLRLGWFGDDLAHRRFILDHLAGRGGSIAWWNMFDGRVADRELVRPGSLFGRLPWWASPEFSFALLRPLSTASHFLDYVLWPSSPWAMHLHNLVLLCIIVAIAGDLYRRLLGAGVASLVALVLFAIDDAHTTSAAWIASRNTLLTAAFVLGTLWLHRRAVHDGSRACALLAPVCLLLAHASSEGGVVVWAYLSAHALFLEQAPLRARVRALLPMAAVSAAWMILSASLGYGVRGSAVYVDPRHDPVLFAHALVTRLPELLELQFTLPPELAHGFSRIASFAYAALLALAVLMCMRRVPVLRFFALSSALALLPQCAAGSFARLLLLSGFAAHGLIAVTLTELFRRSRALCAMLAAGTLAIHGAASLVLPEHARAFALGIHASVLRAAASLPTGQGERDSSIAVLAFPDYVRSVFIDTYRQEVFGPGPERMDVLGVSPTAVRVWRPAEDTLELEAFGGFLLDPTCALVRRPSDRLQVGQQFRLGPSSLEVLSVTPDGRPLRVRVRRQPLQAPNVHWVRWRSREQRFERFEPPAVGVSTWLDPDQPGP